MLPHLLVLGISGLILQGCPVLPELRSRNSQRTWGSDVVLASFGARIQITGTLRQEIEMPGLERGTVSLLPWTVGPGSLPAHWGGTYGVKLDLTAGSDAKMFRATSFLSQLMALVLRAACLFFG